MHHGSQRREHGSQHPGECDGALHRNSHGHRHLVVFGHGRHRQAHAGPVEEPRKAKANDDGQDAAIQERAGDHHIAEDDGFQRKDDRERADLRTKEHQDDASNQDQQADRHHHHREHRLAHEAREKYALDHQAEDRRAGEGHRQTDPHRHAHLNDGPPHHVATEDHQLALCKVEHLGCAVDHHEAHRDEGIEKTGQRTVD